MACENIINDWKKIHFKMYSKKEANNLSIESNEIYDGNTYTIVCVDEDTFFNLIEPNNSVVLHGCAHSGINMKLRNVHFNIQYKPLIQTARNKRLLHRMNEVYMNLTQLDKFYRQEDVTSFTNKQYKYVLDRKSVV